MAKWPWSFQVKNVKLFTDNSNRLPESLKLPKNIYVYYKAIFNFYTISDHGCLCCLLFLYINEDYLLVFIIKELFAWFFVANGWFLWPCMTQAKENSLRRHIHITNSKKKKTRNLHKFQYFILIKTMLTQWSFIR